MLAVRRSAGVVGDVSIGDGERNGDSLGCAMELAKHRVDRKSWENNRKRKWAGGGVS